MRGLISLGLVLAAGLCFAGDEQWLGPSPWHHYRVVEPEPGIFRSTPELFRPAMDTFNYDDNIPADVWAWTQAGFGWGVKFASPAESLNLAGLLVHFYLDWPSPGSNRASFKVFNDSGLNGAPGAELWSSGVVSIVRGQWNFVSIGRTIAGSGYYVFYVQADSFPLCPGLPIDAHNNAPSHRKWAYSPGGVFSEDVRRGDWLIRSVVDWSPQDTNAAALYFASNMPADTVPGIDLGIRVMVKNLGASPLPAGTPVRLRIIGPQGYVYDDTAVTASVLSRGQTAQMTFSPAWRIPATEGNYRIQSWTEAAGEQWPGDDTIAYDLSIARWCHYANFERLFWLSQAAAERATMFNPADFGLQYPVGVTRLRHQFYCDQSAPWPDSTFYFKVYAGDGQALLYQSAPIEAEPGMPGPIVVHDLDPMLVLGSGQFYVSVAPVHPSGHPSSCASDSSKGHSFSGSAGAWQQWELGEFFTSASCRSRVGVAESSLPLMLEPRLEIASYPNPAAGEVRIRWQKPGPGHLSVSLCDPAGRMVRELRRFETGLSGTLVLDTRELRPGVYFVRLETESAAATHKLILGR